MDSLRLQLLGKFPGGEVELDSTLTQSSKAAEAKAVGDALNSKMDETALEALSNLEIKNLLKL